jgi:nucleotide-binding universal stress UspA family protein
MTVIESRQDTPDTRERSAAISVKNVLYATDFSATSESALPYATSICRHFGSTLHVAHILSDTNVLLMTGGVDYVCVGTVYEDAHTEAQEKIQQLGARLGEIPHRTYVRRGPVWTTLSRIVAESSIDMIVVGTHGRSGLGTLLLGSVAEDILRHAPCPVLTVGPGVRGRARLPEFHGNGRELAPVELELQHIVYATSFTPASLTVAPVAIALAEEFESRLTLMHVIEDYTNLGTRPGPIEEGVRQLQAVVPEDAMLAYKSEIVMEFGSVPQGILNTAAERDADLIVLGAHLAHRSTHLPWSTVHEVVAHATCPVLTVRV